MTTNYNYYEAMTQDIKEELNYIDFADYSDKDEAYEDLYDRFWITDSITGNASGSYTFNRCEAKEYVESNFDLLRNAVSEFCEESILGEKFMDEEYEWMDVTIRCHLLSEVLSDVLEEIAF